MHAGGLSTNTLVRERRGRNILVTRASLACNPEAMDIELPTRAEARASVARVKATFMRLRETGKEATILDKELRSGPRRAHGRGTRLRVRGLRQAHQKLGCSHLVSIHCTLTESQMLSCCSSTVEQHSRRAHHSSVPAHTRKQRQG